ncbi:MULTISPECIES: serine/arginine repetitive matrix protein 2 [unclassified Blautia]|uniref:serine/arginine repetitive matrix protein 2 n=1 Tax=unclassified Blautia TaxID=2648079 RepID=UPI003F89D06F
MSKEKMRASRHNGRSGKHGVYDVKHNDRDFDVANSEHIDAERTKLNVYWDCYQGYCLNGDTSERKMTFTGIEKAYYFEHYGDHVDAQNERNEKAGHAERNRTTDDVLKNNKTCPEESILQLGNIDCSVTPDVLAKVVAEFFEEFEKRYGSHVHILDWALHLDEATPHVHVRQVYDALNKYGELCPQQEKALEELGFELPDPTKKRSRFNNRKMCFDAECRKLFLDIGQKNGVELEYEPEYGGASYLEKQDYIIENQQKRIAEMQAALDDITLKVLDMENMVEQIADDAYEKACEVVADTVAEHTREEDIAELRSYKKWLTSDERKTPKDKRDFVGKCLDNLEARFRKMAQAVAKKVLGALQSPQIKEQKKEEIKERARVSVRERLAEHQKQVEMEKQRKAELPKVKKQKTEELG